MEWYNESTSSINATCSAYYPTCAALAITQCPSKYFCAIKLGGGTCNKTCLIYVN